MFLYALIKCENAITRGKNPPDIGRTSSMANDDNSVVRSICMAYVASSYNNNASPTLISRLPRHPNPPSGSRSFAIVAWSALVRYKTDAGVLKNWQAMRKGLWGMEDRGVSSSRQKGRRGKLRLYKRAFVGGMISSRTLGLSTRSLVRSSDILSTDTPSPTHSPAVVKSPTPIPNVETYPTIA